MICGFECVWGTDYLLEVEEEEEEQ